MAGVHGVLHLTDDRQNNSRHGCAVSTVDTNNCYFLISDERSLYRLHIMFQCRPIIYYVITLGLHDSDDLKS